MWHVGKKQNEFRDLVGKSEGKRLLVRPKIRWENDIKTYIKETGLEGRTMNWIDLAQDRDKWRVLVKAVKNNIRIP
jgi:hypothetical protein